MENQITYKFCGTITASSTVFNVWLAPDEHVWVSKVQDPSWGIGNYNNAKAKNTEEAKAAATKMVQQIGY